jgi:hypothetical protein
MIKPFRKYISEARTIKRFIANNPYLTPVQKDSIEQFFVAVKPASKDFEKHFGWQSEFPRIMKWEDFEEFAKKYKYWTKMNINNIKLPGSKGKDYWPIRLSTKEYIANIPLTQKMAQFMNSCKYGTINVNYCIGWRDSTSFWNYHVLDAGEVPIYITNGSRKWVVMIHRDNVRYEVWDKMNNIDISSIDPEPIPNFSIRKELLNKKNAKIYDHIRSNFYIDDTSEIIKEFKDYNNELLFNGKDDSDFQDFLDEFVKAYKPNQFNGCEIVAGKYGLSVTHGEMTGVTIIDKKYPIWLSSVEIRGCNISFSTNSSIITKCDIVGDSQIYNCNVDSCEYISDSTFKFCSIDINEMYDSIIDGCDVKAGYIKGCEVKNHSELSNVGSGMFRIAESEVYDSKIEYAKIEGILFEDCYIDVSILKGGTFISCNLGEDVVKSKGVIIR